MLGTDLLNIKFNKAENHAVIFSILLQVSCIKINSGNCASFGIHVSDMQMFSISFNLHINKYTEDKCNGFNDIDL